MKTISIADITLKKLALERDVNLLFREKTAIAACADSLGTDTVELAPVKSVREDTIIYKTIAQNIQNATLAIPVGFTEEEAYTAWECIKDAKSPRLQIELPVSTVQMEYTYHIKAEKMLSKIASLVACAKKLCNDVEFSALDATRADEDFLIAAVKEAVNAGANMITICDDAATSLPEDIATLITKIKEAVSVPVFVCPSNRVNMAVASAIAAIRAGADGVKCSMASSDALLTGAFSDAVNTYSAALQVEVNLNNTKVHASISDMLANIAHSANDTDNEISDKKKIILDSDCTIAEVSQASKILGYELSDSDCGNVHKALIQVCEKKGAVGAKELEALIASYAMQAPSTYHLENYTTTSSDLVSSMSQVTLRVGNEIISGVSTGDGPIDSVFLAIEQCIGHHYELDDFQVQAVTEGKEALGSALVKLRNNGKLYSGNGLSTDIIAASIRAYINALNKIVSEEE